MSPSNNKSMRRKPGKPLLRYVTRETFGTTRDTTPRTYALLYVVDVDGCVFQRQLREDSAPTRWQPVMRPTRNESRKTVLDRAAKSLASAERRAEHVHVIEDNRNREDGTA